MIDGLDVSVYNGVINWPKVTEKFAIIKMSGGDAGLYIDANANKNYYGAKAAGKIVGGYHFCGGTDPIKEADYFVRAMSPIAAGDILVCDWEVSHINPVNWVEKFMDEVRVKTGVYPWLYINASTANAYDWSPVLKNSGLWVADYAVAPQADVPIKYTYIAQQYTDSPYDKDVFFGTEEQLKAYGFKVSSIATPTPAPKPATPAPTTVLGKIGSTLPTPPAPAPGTVITSTADGTSVTTLSTSTATSIPVKMPAAVPTPIQVTATPSKRSNFIVRFVRWLKEKL